MFWFDGSLLTEFCKNNKIHIVNLLLKLVNNRSCISFCMKIVVLPAKRNRKTKRMGGLWKKDYLKIEYKSERTGF